MCGIFWLLLATINKDFLFVDKENSNPGTPHSSVTSPLSVQ